MSHSPRPCATRSRGSTDPRAPPALRQILPERAVDEPDRSYPEIDALEALIELVRAHAPMLLVLDDLHWADQATLGGDRVSPAPLCRPPARDRRSRTNRGARPRPPVPTTGPEPRRRARAAHGRRICPRSRSPSSTSEPAETPPSCQPRSDRERRAISRERFLRRYSPAAARRGRGHTPYCSARHCSTIRSTHEILAEIADVDASSLTEQLDHLCDRGLLAIDGLRYRFRYGIHRDALRGSISPARQRILGARAHSAERDRAWLEQTDRGRRAARSESAERARRWWGHFRECRDT